jgi:hypothetical protein
MFRIEKANAPLLQFWPTNLQKIHWAIEAYGFGIFYALVG